MPNRTLHGVTLTQTEPHGYEFKHGACDYHVRKDGSKWRLDAFDSSIKDADTAWISSDDFATLKEAVKEAVAPPPTQKRA